MDGAEADGAGGGGGQVQDAGGVAEGDWVVVVGGAAAGAQTDSGGDTAGFEALEERGIPVGDAVDDEGAFVLDVSERDRFLLRHFAVHGGDAVAVGVEFGMAEFGGDALFEALGDEMLEALGFRVDFFDGVIEQFVEEGFDEAVVAEDLEGAAPASG